MWPNHPLGAIPSGVGQYLDGVECFSMLANELESMIPVIHVCAADPHLSLSAVYSIILLRLLWSMYT